MNSVRYFFKLSCGHDTGFRSELAMLRYAALLQEDCERSWNARRQVIVIWKFKTPCRRGEGWWMENQTRVSLGSNAEQSSDTWEKLWNQIGGKACPALIPATVQRFWMNKNQADKAEDFVLFLRLSQTCIIMGLSDMEESGWILLIWSQICGQDVLMGVKFWQISWVTALMRYTWLHSHIAEANVII